jgi:hypothetical protein
LYNVIGTFYASTTTGRYPKLIIEFFYGSNAFIYGFANIPICHGVADAHVHVDSSYQISELVLRRVKTSIMYNS